MAKNYDATWKEQSSAPDTPDTDQWKLYPKSDGFYGVDDAGTEFGPLGGVQRDTTDVSNPPTDAELDTAFGTPAEVGSGFIRIVDDDDGDANVYLALSNGTSWWYATLTKAT